MGDGEHAGCSYTCVKLVIAPQQEAMPDTGCQFCTRHPCIHLMGLLGVGAGPPDPVSPLPRPLVT